MVTVFGKYCRRINNICQERSGCSGCTGSDEEANALRVPLKPPISCPYVGFPCLCVPGCSGCPLYIQS